MKSVSGKTFCRIVERYGWVLRRLMGSHHIYSQKDSTVRLVMPAHGNRDLPIGTLKSLMRYAGLQEEDLQ
ncbi:type II toxin-antitoxin system HicA family toxin [Thermosynechococcaceae cyanobacterium BACA0444]|uniref:Type II toxin-antitoxin system HicA family toxin n=1 Tax=Pseudocalidococcus azoricus BACA0444 TaxID=2918990 RepID=A0AAE4FUH3_9CYAN|nr:type II toxin-antitoxin system HicA family toxin [Pseudocalidococcus azoricus]MDS3861115.1 type II toxin-antitoxin system HicA family toxin [Pseudocalidococcus azoricus BACA0444]